MFDDTNVKKQSRLIVKLSGLKFLAEEVRFELTVGVNPRQFSRL